MVALLLTLDQAVQEQRILLLLHSLELLLLQVDHNWQEASRDKELLAHRRIQMRTAMKALIREERSIPGLSITFLVGCDMHAPISNTILQNT